MQVREGAVFLQVQDRINRGGHGDVIGNFVGVPLEHDGMEGSERLDHALAVAFEGGEDVVLVLSCREVFGNLRVIDLVVGVLLLKAPAEFAGDAGGAAGAHAAFFLFERLRDTESVVGLRGVVDEFDLHLGLRDDVFVAGLIALERRDVAPLCHDGIDPLLGPFLLGCLRPVTVLFVLHLDVVRGFHIAEVEVYLRDDVHDARCRAVDDIEFADRGRGPEVLLLEGSKVEAFSIGLRLRGLNLLCLLLLLLTPAEEALYLLVADGPLEARADHSRWGGVTGLRPGERLHEATDGLGADGCVEVAERVRFGGIHRNRLLRASSNGRHAPNRLARVYA
ncbi:MAG: hypothetical protein IPI85_12820 [Dehalococcoidia bacterium]|nr:hypothetical protein [Dehalococcoidia bacterium]